MGHSVIPFAMQHERNRKTPYAQYFASKVDLSYDRKKTFWNEIKTAGRIIYSFEAQRKLASLIGDTKPDIAHVRNVYHQLTPSVLWTLNKMGIPTVLTIADYKIICPAYGAFVQGRPCLECRGKLFYKTVQKKCVRDSLVESTLLAIESTLHQLILDSYRKNVDIFISPSEFVRQKMIGAGLPENKLVHLPHFCDSSKFIPEYESDNYIVFFGRIDHRKGLQTLLNAMQQFKTLNLLILGEGPERNNLEDYIRTNNISNVTFLGHKDGEELISIVKRAKFCILPSESYETFGNTILESFACGKTVIASRIGAIPELINDGENGYLFEPGNVDDLVSKINLLESNHNRILEMGKCARVTVEEKYKPEDHYQKLITIYKSLQQ
jgi:glycosyltransferase involved in cell wall biosynthesis